MIVAPLAAFGSLTRLPVGSYRSVPETRLLITRLKREITDLASAAGAPLAADMVDKTMDGIDELPPDWKPSMQLDVESGHRSELDAIIGVICRKGREWGVPTPVADYRGHVVSHVSVTELPRHRTCDDEVRKEPRPGWTGQPQRSSDL